MASGGCCSHLDQARSGSASVCSWRVGLLPPIFSQVRDDRSEFAVGAALGKEDLSGSVVRVGGQWSVVKSSAPGRLVVWGKITDESAKLEILDDYLAPK